MQYAQVEPNAQPIQETSGNTRPVFSVVMPIHNKGPHIARAVASVFAQTFDSYEIILVDDASTDDSLEIMESFGDSRIKLLKRTEPGPGGYAARNLAMAEAKGTWAAFLDADDEWLPDHLERLHALAETFPDVYLLGAGWRTFDGNSHVDCPYYRAYQSEGNHRLTLTEYLERCFNQHRRAVHTSVAAVRLDSDVTPDLFPAGRGAKRGGDIFAWLRILMAHKSVAWSNHIGAIYHVDSVNMVTKTSASSPILWNKESWNAVRQGLTKSEQKVVGRYFNRSLKHGWLNNTLNKHSRAGFRAGLNRQAGLMDYGSHKLLMMMPAWLLRFVKKVKG